MLWVDWSDPLDNSSSTILDTDNILQNSSGKIEENYKLSIQIGIFDILSAQELPDTLHQDMS